MTRTRAGQGVRGDVIATFYNTVGKSPTVPGMVENYVQTVGIRYFG